MQTTEKSNGWVDINKSKTCSFDVVIPACELGSLDPERWDDGPLVKEKAGDEWRGPCPFPDHAAKLRGKQKLGAKAQFYANAQKGVFNCFGCKRKGNVLDFVIFLRFEGNGKRVREAAMWLLSLDESEEQEGTDNGEEMTTVTPERVEEMLELLCQMCSDPAKRKRIAIGIARVMSGE